MYTRNYTLTIANASFPPRFCGDPPGIPPKQTVMVTRGPPNNSFAHVSTAFL